MNLRVQYTVDIETQQARVPSVFLLGLGGGGKAWKERGEKKNQNEIAKSRPPTKKAVAIFLRFPVAAAAAADFKPQNR